MLRAGRKSEDKVEGSGLEGKLLKASSNDFSIMRPKHDSSCQSGSVSGILEGSGYQSRRTGFGQFPLPSCLHFLTIP